MLVMGSYALCLCRMCNGVIPLVCSGVIRMHGVFRKKGDKNGHLFGFVPNTYFCLLDHFWIFVLRLEILFCSNHYFIVCIFKYRKSYCVNSGLEI